MTWYGLHTSLCIHASLQASLFTHIVVLPVFHAAKLSPRLAHLAHLALLANIENLCFLVVDGSLPAPHGHDLCSTR